MTPSNLADYERKPERYFQGDRPEMLQYVPQDSVRVLDVGCGNGLFGRSLQLRQPCEVWGVEMMLEAAQVASSHLHRVLNEPFSPQIDLPAEHFDCIIFNDCLEHLENPEMALKFALQLLTIGGVVVASIPNMRYFPVMKALVARGEWEYADSGILDRTHLRFFTQKSIAGMFYRSGYTVERLEGINAYLWGGGRLLRALNAIFLGNLADMRFQQFAVVARAKSH